VAIGKAPSSRDIRELTVTSPATQQIPRSLGSPVGIVRRSRQGDTSIASRVEIAEPISHQLQLRESEADLVVEQRVFARLGGALNRDVRIQIELDVVGAGDRLLAS
jgi:hypothetical protein